MATFTLQLEGFSSVDWQTTKPTVRDRTAFLFNNSLMRDIKFVVTDSKRESDDVTQVRVPAHKLVLAISSPVFEAMFYGDLAEKGEEIELPDTESPYLLEFLRFTYCDEVHLTVDNAFGVLYLAQKYIVPLLADKCWSFIDENTCACLKSDAAVSTLNHGNLVSLLQRESLHIAKELDLFDAVKHWAEAKSKQEDLEPTGEAVRKILGEALHLIRFPTISPQDFVRQVVPSGIMTDKEALDMHQYFYRFIPARDVKFPETYRAGITSNAKLLECCRYSAVTVATTGVGQATSSGGFTFGSTTSSGSLLGSATSASAKSFGQPARASGSLFGSSNAVLLGSAQVVQARASSPLQEASQPKDVKEINENLEIMVEPRNLHLKGVHIITGYSYTESKQTTTLFGSLASAQLYTAEVSLLDENEDELAAEAGTYPANVQMMKIDGERTYGIVVKFKDPVLLWKSSKYTIEVKVGVETRLKLSKDLLNFVKQDGLYFNFEGSSRHIYKLLFHKLD